MVKVLRGRRIGSVWPVDADLAGSGLLKLIRSAALGASARQPVVVLQQAAEALVAHDRTVVAGTIVWEEQPIPEALVVTLAVVVRDIRAQRAPQPLFANDESLRQRFISG